MLVSLAELVASRLQPTGFKLLFDVIASQPAPLRIKELGYAFGVREAGLSKFDARVVLEYAGLLAAKLSRGLVSARSVYFILAGVGSARTISYVRATSSISVARSADDKSVISTSAGRRGARMTQG